MPTTTAAAGGGEDSSTADCVAAGGARLARLLANDTTEQQRAIAYSELEATENVGLAVVCVAPLVTILRCNAQEIGPSELRRASLVLGHLIALDHEHVGGEWFKDGRWLAAWSSEVNALADIRRKPVGELTRADALVYGAHFAALAASVFSHDYTKAITAGGTTAIEFWTDIMTVLTGQISDSNTRLIV